MKGITIQELYDLRETIAAELFEGKTFPWEVLPEIHFRKRNMRKRERISGSPGMPKSLRQHPSPVPVSSGKARK